MSVAREAYNKYYSVEIDLNRTFNKFVSNYHLAYQGPNTARAQIGAKLDTSEFVAIGELSAVFIPIIICIIKLPLQPHLSHSLDPISSLSSSTIPPSLFPLPSSLPSSYLSRVQ